MNLTEKKLDSKTIFQGKIFSVTKDNVELPNGLLRTRDVVHHNGGVVILAELNGQILMVKQYRYPTKEALFELPAGKLDKENEDIIDAAKRELEEETGYVAKKWESLGFIWPTPGFCNEKLYLFKASELTKKEQNLEEGEIIHFSTIEKSKVFEMIKNGEINDSKTICAIMRGYCL